MERTSIKLLLLTVFVVAVCTHVQAQWLNSGTTAVVQQDPSRTVGISTTTPNTTFSLDLGGTQWNKGLGVSLIRGNDNNDRTLIIRGSNLTNSAEIGIYGQTTNASIMYSSNIGQKLLGSIQFIANYSNWQNGGKFFFKGYDGVSQWPTTMIINPKNGNVAIGNTLANNYAKWESNTNYSLFVEKGILTERLKVALVSSTEWADYVFADNYKLMSLYDVERFINENKHLPDVPSAQQLVDEGGIDMNDMFARQMAKIEELTLYLIKLQKENDQLKQRITNLENK